MYLISILAIIVISGFMTVGSAGAGIFWPVDYFMMLIILLINLTIIASAGLLRDFNNAFRLSIPRKNRKASVGELKRAIEAVRLSRKIAFVTGIFILLFEGTQILIKGEFDIEEMSSNIGGMLFSGLTGALYTAAVVLVLLPMESMLRARLWSRQENEE